MERHEKTGRGMTENKQKLKEIEIFADKYIAFFENEFGRSKESYYRFFDDNVFPNACENLGFEMDCGHSFIEAYGSPAWNSIEGLQDKIADINDLALIGNALYSQWRYYNHWSSPSYADNDTKQWFLMLFRRLKGLGQK